MGTPFTGISTDTVLSYNRPGFTTDTYNRVTSIATDKLSLVLKYFIQSPFERI